MFNLILLAGNLGAHPEFKLLPGGQKMARFSLATSSRWKDGAGEWQEHTDWHRVVVYRESTAHWVKERLKKGDKILVEGKLTYRRIQDQNGKFYRIPYIVISGPYGQIKPLSSQTSLIGKTNNVAAFEDTSESEHDPEHDPEPDHEEDSFEVHRNYFHSNQKLQQQ